MDNNGNSFEGASVMGARAAEAIAASPNLAGLSATFEAAAARWMAMEDKGLRFGVTRRMLGTDLGRRGLATAAELAALTPMDAKRILYERVWRPLAGDRLPPDVAALIFDIAAARGVERATKYLQKGLIDAHGGRASLPTNGRLDEATFTALATTPAVELAEQILARRMTNVSRAGEGRLFGRKGLVLVARAALLATRLGVLKF